ncbi:LOW QUALITY PROTEIN: calcium homeostasis modulator protein 6-like [Corvus moneduloides]|uniref:LOW QUALITY PROTEIN: calcium homeostasis modulator protein 6-like n=1 Tax=Corvus moneduloides TaxID=1196302 RepID=UPI001363BCDB|nr:LOW QUALITY PROTEIN: calcium homeostasis modulator protein 6-like [Corvus moneduloides]
MDRLRETLDFCIRHQTILGSSAVSLLTAATEHIFSSVVFKCPSNSGNMVYGSFFLLVPAFILLLLGYMVNTRIWHQLTGGCSQEKECSASESCAHFCQVLVPVTARALVAPLTWIAVALLGANFYECAASGSSLTQRLFCKDKGPDCQEKLFKIPCDVELAAHIPGDRLSLQAQSQLIGWFLIASIMTVALISKCVSRCCSSVSYLQHKFQKIYSKEEQEVFEIKAKEHATKLAERNTNCFFTTTDPAPFPTPSKEEWRKISLLCTFDSQEVYYDTIHKYTSKKGGQSAESMEED